MKLKAFLSLIFSALLAFSVVPLASADESEQTRETREMLEEVNINTADAELLTTLDGVGESRAEQIVTWREENGEFTEVDDLLQISGIGPVTLENNRDRLVLD